MIDFYVETSADIPTHIGFCHILPSNMKDSLGSVTVPITSMKQEPLGQIHCKFTLNQLYISVYCIRNGLNISFFNTACSGIHLNEAFTE